MVLPKKSGSFFASCPRISAGAVVLSLAAVLSGCGITERPQRPAWRNQAEQACISQRLVQVSNYVQPAREIDGPGICGVKQPFKVAALSRGTVAVKSTGTLGCPMIASLDKWVSEVVQPAAQARFGQPVVEISSVHTYSCRSVNNRPGSKLSEHAFGNAIDIGNFTLADGREVKILRDWTRGDEASQSFLRELHSGACDHFTTVLGPGSDPFHYNHFHFDLAMHGNTSRGPRRICRPKPPQQQLPPKRDNLPDPPEIDIELDIARRGGQRGPQFAQRPPARAYAAASPGIVMQPERLRAMPRPQGNIGAAPPQQNHGVGEGFYGRLQAGSGTPMQLHQSLPRGTGMLRDDGIFVPPGELAD
jgi:hypothetical protein